MYNQIMKRIPQKEREVQIIKRAEELGHEFIGFLDGYKNKESKLIIRCKKHGDWNPAIENYVRNGRCRQCVIDSQRSKNPQKRINKETPSHIHFVRFVGEYKNQETKAVVKCDFHGYSTKSVTDLLNKNSYCTECGKKRVWAVKSLGEKESTLRILKKCKVKGYSFLGLVDGYSDRSSRVKISCPAHGDWETSYMNFMDSKHGCPSCGKHGFKIDKPATIYLLRSSCGQWMKIGITNDLNTRKSSLELSTPFDFNVIELINGDGSYIAAKEKEAHSLFTNARMKGFNGATEWFFWDHSVLSFFKQL